MNKIWYAVMSDMEDTDWGTGSNDYEAAVAQVKDLREKGYKEAHIAVIDNGPDPICIEEIHDFDF